MSYKVAARVWEHSQHRGTTKLLLLALAEYARDDGICWPSVATLAERINETDRRVRQILQDLIREGDIARLPGGGRGNTTRYAVLTGLSTKERSRLNSDLQNTVSGNTETSKTLKSVAENTEICGTETLKSGAGDEQAFGALGSAKEGQVDGEIHHEPLIEPSIGGGDPLFKPMFAAIAATCQLDLNLCTAAQRNQVAQTAKALRKAGKLPEEIPKVEAWWYASDWRGKKGEPPRPAQLQEVWPQAMEQRNGTDQQKRPTGNHRNGRLPERLDGG